MVAMLHDQEKIKASRASSGPVNAIQPGTPFRRAINCFAFTAILVVIQSCAPSQSSKAPQTVDSNFVGPSPTLAQTAAPPSQPAEATAAPQSSPAISNAQRDRRDDGRPTWWIDDLKREHGEVFVAAEALAPDLRAARRAAIDAGVSRLTRELGAPPKDWVVKATMIRPLRAVRGPESVNKFVGYVLIAAAE